MPLLILFQRQKALGLCLFLSVLGASAAAPRDVKAAIPKEYQVKAAFLFNLAQFVTWPSSAFSKPDEPFTIGILGKDPFGTFLDETVRGEKIGGHPLGVRRFVSPGDVKGCQVLFISSSESGKIKGILDGLKGKAVLTVADFEGFATKGGMVRFRTVRGKVRFRINLEAAKRANLTISSRILRVAEIVQPGRD